MPNWAANPFFVASCAAALSALFTLCVRSFAWRRKIVATPKSDRWHKRPTAMLGGIGIFAAVGVIYLVLVPHTNQSLVVLGGSAFLFLVGLIDDLISIRPYQKLIGQLIGAGILVLSGLKLPLTGFDLVDIWITVFWVIGITNAINLLDNMDGLAAGISAIAAFSLALNFAANGLTNELLLIAALIGSLLGFLIFNFNPASIFMGDCGSMFIGFMLSGSVLLNQVGGRSRNILAILAVPVLTLFVPIFDTTFVTLLRKAWGRKASQGGRDHTSHRLVALGLSERTAVLLLYALAVIAGGMALLVGQISVVRSFALIGFFTIVLVTIGAYLSKVKVYEGEQDEKAAADNAVFAFLINVSHKRRLIEVFLDAMLVTLAYYSAWALLFRRFEETYSWNLFLATVPLLILIKVGSLLVVGVYRGLWRYTSIGDLITIAKGVLLGSGLSVLAILLLYRFDGFSRVVFFLDAVLLLLGIVGSRMAFRVIRQVLPSVSAGDGLRVLIYGAGDGGEMLLRELNNNPEWHYQAVGFVDDDPQKKDKVIHGLKVFGGNGDLADLCTSKEVSEILISIRHLPPDRLKQIRELCRAANVTLKRAQMNIDPVDLI